MSVYTVITRDELVDFLAEYDVGTLLHFEGISSGIENTNYFVDTSKSRYVLTLFEQHTPSELPFFLDLTAFLSEKAVPCAHPKANNAGEYLGQLKGKPVALVDRLPGRSVDQPEPGHCRAVGHVLAKMHLAGQRFPQKRNNPRGPHWWRVTAKALEGRVGKGEFDIISNELEHQSKHQHDHLPRGIVHADLFRDNVLFDDDQLSGLIDFYYACTDVLLYDLAVTLNDWCMDEGGHMDAERSGEMLKAYQSVRPISAEERSAYPVMLRAAALRFWLSRLYDLHFPREGEITHIKNPDVFRNILLNHISHERALKA